MKNFATFLLCGIIGIFSVIADNVIIKSPGYFKAPIRDGHELFPDSLIFARDAESIHIPDIGMIGRFENYGFTNLKKVSFGNIDYIPGGLFWNNKTIEEIEFNGLIGHFDCSLVLNCPNLRKIIFHGPISGTGGPGFAHNCPQLDSVIFEGAVVNFGLGIFPDQLCPKLANYINNGAFLAVYNDSLTPKTTLDHLRNNPAIISDLERIADWQAEVLTATDPGWMRTHQYKNAKILLPVLEQLNSDKSIVLKKAMDYAWNLGDEVKTDLEILKESPAYKGDTIQKPEFVYAQPSDSLLRLSRERFNLDSIAGNGDEISRIKNLLYWIHNNIEHDGSNGLAPGARNLRNTYDCSKRDSCGYNCRALAICLTEALLAEGIPARYLTCESKNWDTDNDCHVICVAWSESLGKWIWIDPTFAAYVTDENGLLLHPGEVRYRLQHDMPLILNDDANWNNRYKEDQEHYLDEYMAKNLYIMSANTLNQAEPEGETIHNKGKVVALIPEGSNYTNAHIITTDEEWFWAAPYIIIGVR
ncbi:MAG: transglutaminase-like domain-containing protein [Muribaculaceae bacterium]|nr:transglutaminase-like domain-containing protein [Muribaculaceae bacterium]